MMNSSSSSNSNATKGKKRYRGKDHDQRESSSSTKTRTSEINAVGSAMSSNNVPPPPPPPPVAAETGEKVTTRGMMRQMMEQEGLKNVHTDDLVHEVKMIQELPKEIKDVLYDDDDDDDDDEDQIKQPGLLEWDDDFGWNPSWVFEERLGLCGSWDWDWIWYPYWDMMIDNWAFDGDDDILWDDDIWSIQDTNDKNETVPKK